MEICLKKIVSMDNIQLVYKNAKKGKSRYREAKMIEQNPEFYLKQIQELLVSKSFTTSQYQICDIKDKNKIRTIHKLPFFPDRIVHHALIQIIEPILINSLIRDTFQSIKGRGVSDARNRVKTYINKHNPTYCLKLDITKYYPSIDNSRLKEKLRKKIKCKDSLWLIDDIIDSTIGLPIGNYTSQHFGNFYLSDFDHYIKEQKRISGYFRYCDDMIFLLDDKPNLHLLKKDIFKYIKKENLTLKRNWKIFPISKQKLDFVGYVFKQNRIVLRKSIFVSFKKKLNNINTKQITKNDVCSIAAFFGWFKPINLKPFWKLYESVFRR